MKRIKFTYAALLFVLLLFPQAARAYIDPATTTYLIQIVSAVVITLGVTVGIFFSRFKMFFLNLRVRQAEWKINLLNRKQGIKKQAPVQTFSQRYTIAPTNKWQALFVEDRSFFKRLLTAFLVSFALCFTLVFFGIFEIYVLNLNTFAFRITDLLVYLVLGMLVPAIVLSLLVALLRGRLYDLAISLLFFLLLAGYLQGNFLNLSLGELTGDAIPWHNFRKEPLINIAIWAMIGSLVLLVRYIKRKAWTGMVRYVSLLLVAMQVVSLISLVGTLGAAGQPDNTKYLSRQGLYEVSAKENIIVIVLDRLDNQYIQEVLADDPAFFTPLDGFTRFTNHTTSYSQTFPAVANYLTGVPYFFEIPQGKYMSSAFTQSPQLPGLKDAGYHLRLFMEPRYAFQDAADLDHFADNVITQHTILRKGETFRKMMILSLYRYSPLVLKPFFWTSTDAYSSLSEAENAPAPYNTDDFAFYAGLVNRGLQKTEEGKTFLYIHLNGPHAPFNMDEHINQVPEEYASAFTQTKGSFRLVYEYLDQLKTLGKYKDSTIIIMADHGARDDDYFDITKPITAGLFVKPAGVSGAALINNAAPVSTDNFMPTIYQAAGLEHSKLGRSYFEVPADDPTPRYLYHMLLANAEHPRVLVTYQIDGDANDFANWKKIKQDEIAY